MMKASDIGLDGPSLHAVGWLSNISELIEPHDMMVQIYHDQVRVVDQAEKDVVSITLAELRRVGFSRLYDRVETEIKKKH